MGPTCEDPVLSLLPPTTLVGGAPLPSPIESYNLIFVPGTCNASPSVDQTSGNQKINVLASQFQPVAGSNMVSYTISQQFAAGQNVRFVAQACLPGSNCSVDTNEACDVVAPPN